MVLVLAILACAFALILYSEAQNTNVLLEPCNITEPNLEHCWIQKIEDLRPNLIQGIQEWHLPSIDPIYLSKLTVGKRKFSEVSYQANWKNIVFTGGKDFQILSINIDPEELLFKLRIALPSFNLSTLITEIDGDVLGYHLSGDGRLELVLTNVVVDLVLDGERYNKDSKEYIQWRKGSLEVVYDTVYYEFFQSSKDPFELLVYNHAVNAKIDAFKGVIKSFLERTVGNLIIRAINKVHGIYPAEVLYPY